MLAATLSLTALCAVVPPAVVVADTRLEVDLLPAHVRFRVIRGDQLFLGAAIASLDAEVAGARRLPPLLVRRVVLGAGLGYPGRGFELEVPEHQLPPGIAIYAHGVGFGGGRLSASDAQSFVLDASGASR